MAKVKAPSQFDMPAPSVPVPSNGMVTEVPVDVSVRIRGEPAKREHESPILKPAQLVLDDPGPSAVTV